MLSFIKEANRPNLTTTEKQSPETLEDEDNIIRKAQADPAFFRPVYELYYKRIFQFVLHRVGDRDTSADITQQVFVKALTSLSKYTFRGLPFSSWLYRVAINECNELFRKSKKIRYVTIEKSNISELYEEMTVNFEQEDLEQRIPDILQKLKTDELTLIELRFFEKRSFREIAELMGLTEVNAKIWTYRVLKKMKQLFIS
jgi:RNA polymerase sigma-70 factor, ECF subfamily